MRGDSRSPRGSVFAVPPVRTANHAVFADLPARTANHALLLAQTAGAGYVGYSTPETCWTTRMTWQE